MNDFRDCLDTRLFAAMGLQGMPKPFSMRGMDGSATLLWALERNVVGIGPFAVSQN